MTKPPHSIYNNISYFLKLQFRLGKPSLFLLIILIPVSLALALCNIYLPKLIVQGILNFNKLYDIIVSLSILGLAIILLNALNGIIDTLNYTEMLKYTRALTFLKIEKTIRTDYENIESSRCRHLLQRADQALWTMGADSTASKFPKSITGLITDIFGFILFGTLITAISPYLAALLIGTQALHFFIIQSVQKKQYLSREHTEPLDRKLWYIADNSGDYRSGKDIRIYGMNHWFVKLYKDLSKERFAWDRKFSVKYFLASLFEGLIILLRDGFAYTMLIYMTLNQQITIDNFVLYFGVIGSFATWVGGIINKIIDISDASLKLCDLRDYLDYGEKNNRRDSEKTTSAVPVPLSIELDNVCYRFKDAEHDTIQNVNISIQPGEKIAIVGLNGAGKTTLIKLICGLYSATSGKVHIAGKEKNEYNIYDYYSLFSIVFQDFHFLPVSIACNVAGQEKDVLDRDRVTNCLKHVGLFDAISHLPDGQDTLLNKQIHENGTELSGGEQQKLLLARAIYKDAPILILDEPTAALDPIAENELYQKYNELTQNKTSIFISHRLSSTRFCDRILFFEQGKIVESGSHDELMRKNGKYHYLYQVQSQYYN